MRPQFPANQRPMGGDPAVSEALQSPRVGSLPSPSYRAAYEGLEARMKALAEADGEVFWPNPEPLGRVDYIFVCMEPSLGTGSADRTRSFIEAARCFVNSLEEFLLSLQHQAVPMQTQRAVLRHRLVEGRDAGQGGVLTGPGGTTSGIHYCSRRST
jgi:hypothetical protein